MARIRTIKPEFPQSESMGLVSRESRLCFILLFTVADDSGRLRGNSRMLASLLYPYDDDAKVLIDKWLSELVGQSCIVRYVIEGNQYIQICKWLNHQKIDKPSASKIPEFVEGSRGFVEGSTTDMDMEVEGGVGVSPSALVSPSAQPLVSLTNKSLQTSQELKTVIDSPVQIIFNHWQTVMNHKKAVLSDKTEKLIKARFKDGFTLEALIEAVDGCAKNPHNMGENDRNTRYDGLDLILRDGENTNRFIGYNTTLKPYKPKIDGLSKAGNKSVEALNNWLGEPENNDEF